MNSNDEIQTISNSKVLCLFLFLLLFFCFFFEKKVYYMCIIYGLLVKYFRSMILLKDGKKKNPPLPY
ncbi:hypothetical protein BY996DRAFT_4396678 [Phakopsora pachyrhizi]|nr:hypothetical protein BY996DRAFT_4396678 [Phakopsora pachyrhizi]